MNLDAIKQALLQILSCCVAKVVANIKLNNVT